MRAIGGTLSKGLGPMAGCSALDVANNWTGGSLQRNWQAYVIDPVDHAASATLSCILAGSNHILAAVSSVNPLVSDREADLWRLNAGWITSEEYLRRHPEEK